MSYESERKWDHMWDDVLFEGPREGDGRKVLDYYFKKFKELHPVSRLKRSFKEGPMSLVVRKDGRPAPVLGEVRDMKFDMKDFGEMKNEKMRNEQMSGHCLTLIRQCEAI